MRILRSIALVAALAAAVPAVAHHGWGNYDASQALTLTGVIKSGTYDSAHSIIQLEVPGKTWTVILAPPSRMQARGVPKEMLTSGKSVTVVGYPHRTDKQELRAERITVDGKTAELR